MRPKMALKDEDLPITMNRTKAVTGPPETSSTISRNEWDSYAPCCYLALDSLWLGLDPRPQYDDWCVLNL